MNSQPQAFMNIDIETSLMIETLFGICNATIPPRVVETPETPTARRVPMPLRTVERLQLQDPHNVVRKLAKIFSRYPSVRLQLQQRPETAHEKVADEFARRLKFMVGEYVFEYYFRELLDHGHLSLGRLKKMHYIDCFSDPAGDYALFIDDLRHLSQSEKNLLMRSEGYFHRVLGFMNEQNQKAATAALMTAQLSVTAQQANAMVRAPGIQAVAVG